MVPDVNSISPPPAKSDRGAWIFIFIFGVVFPILALGVELTFRFCAEVFFNPIPSVFHGVLIALGPGAEFMGVADLEETG